MYKTVLLFCGILVINHNALAQQYHGIVSDVETGNPIPYATIGIKGKPVGTVADTNGNFRLIINESVTSEDKVEVSCIGYHDQILSFQAFVEAGNISLKPQIVPLEKVAISPGRYKTKTVGRSGTGGLGHYSFFTKQDTAIDNDLGREVGTIFNIKKGAFLKEFKFFVEQNQFSAVKFRLMIYDMEDGRPGELIINQNVIISVDDNRAGWITKDLTPYNLMINETDKLAVSLQWIDSSESGREIKYFQIPAAFPSIQSGLVRSKSNAKWKKYKVNPSMRLTFEYRVK